MLALTMRIGKRFVIDWTPILLIGLLIVLLCWLDRIDIKTLARNFKQGKVDRKFISKCEKYLRKLQRTAKGRQVCDYFHLMLCSAYIDTGDEDKFLEHLNAFGRQDPEMKRALQMLFLQYFSGERYQRIVSDVQAGEEEQQISIEEYIRQRGSVFIAFEKKYLALREKISNGFVLQALVEFASIVKAEPDEQ